MKIYLIILFAVFTLLSCQDAVLSPITIQNTSDSEIVIPPKPPSQRFPFGIGSVWIYNVYPFSDSAVVSNIIADSVKEEVISIDTAMFENNKVKVYNVLVNSFQDKKRQYIKKYFWFGDTLYENVDYTRPILIYPLSVGKKWKTTYYDIHMDSVYTENSNIVSIGNINIENKSYYSSYLLKYVSNDKHGIYLGEEDSYFSKDIGYLQKIDYSFYHQAYFGMEAALRLKSYIIIETN